MNGKIRLFVVRGFAVILALLAAVLGIKYALPVLLPFLIGYLASMGVRPVAMYLQGKTGASKKLWATGIIIAGVGLLLFLVWLLCRTVVKEAGELIRVAGELMSDSNSPLRSMSDKVMEAARGLSIGTDGEGIDLNGIIANSLSALVGGATRILQGAASRFPSYLLFCAVTVLSAFYFSCDFESITSGAKGYIPKNVMDTVGRWWSIILRSLLRFLRAYFVLFCINYAVLSAGLLILRVGYPFLAALLCAFVDILPVFGVGTVLVPLSVFMLLTGQTGKGIGLIILLCIMYALRQVLEVRLVGRAAGVHPILALFSVFAGFKLLGIGGVITAPLLLNGAAILWEEKGKKLE